jgi:hypothetical protein
MAIWADQFIGLPYQDGVFDCTHLIGKVQEEVFGKVIPLPTERQPTAFGLSAQVDHHKETYFTRITEDEAVDGDVVIMRSKKRLNHIGVYFRDKKTSYVLHNLKNVGSVCTHRIRDLPRINLEVEGFYRFKSITELNQRVNDKYDDESRKL